MGSTLDWNMVLYSSFYALIMVPFSTLAALVFWSVLLLGTKYIPKLVPKINVLSVPPPWLSVKKPHIAYSGVHKGSALLAMDAVYGVKRTKPVHPRASRLRGKQHYRPHHRPSNEAPTVHQQKTIRQHNKVIDLSTKARAILSTKEQSRANP